MFFDASGQIPSVWFDFMTLDGHNLRQLCYPEAQCYSHKVVLLNEANHVVEEFS